MFTAGDLPWTEQTPPGAPAGEPASEPSAVPDLAEEAGAAFEEVLEEDFEIGGAAEVAPAEETEEASASALPAAESAPPAAPEP